MVKWKRETDEGKGRDIDEINIVSMNVGKSIIGYELFLLK